MPPHPYGWLSLLPPVVAIALAIVTRRAVASLLAGIVCGALITSGGRPLVAIYNTLEVQLWPTLIEPDKLRVFAFTLLMGAMVGVVTRCGGMLGLVELISPLARTRRGGQLATWATGLLIFFDDYANTMLLGNTFRPLCDRLRISREKLAYLVDSTAAPVAGISLLSTWVAVEIDYVRDGVEAIGTGATGGDVDWNAFALFVDSIPYRFYVLGSLLLIPIVAILGRDFPPMLAAERRAIRGGSGDAQREDHSTAPVHTDQAIDATASSHWINAVLPIAVTVAVVVWLLLATGRQSLSASLSENETAAAAVDSQQWPLREVFGAADAGVALMYGSLAGLFAATGMCFAGRLLNGRQVMAAAGRGAALLLPAIAILWTASTLSRMTGDRSVDGAVGQNYEFRDHRLYTGDYLSQLIRNESDNENGDAAADDAITTLRLMPTIVFLLAGVVSFCTGTSFGTMGLLTPMVITLTYALLSAGGSAVSPQDPLLLASIGAVLAGAVFGDHCSPISDTTILSSQACQCDHMAHVLTQLPYAASVAVVSVTLGTLPIGWGAPLWLLLPLQAAALLAIVMLFGRRTETG